MKIELIKTSGTWFVAVDDKIADELSNDEALAVVAQALFSGASPRYVKTKSEWLEIARTVKWARLPDDPRVRYLTAPRVP